MVDQAEIHRKVASDKVEERREAAEQLRSDFADLPDKTQAWRDLIRLTEDEDSRVQWYAADALGTAFPHVPEKEEAWNDLIWLMEAEDCSVRWHAADALDRALPHIPHKKRAWRDLHRLTHYKDERMRSNAAYAVGSTFQHIPEKEEAWRDLHRLADDEDSGVRSRAADALGSAFQHIPEKEEAWNDLIRMTDDEDRNVQWNAAYSLDSAFTHVPEKEKVWNDLIQLTEHADDGYVRISAIHSLGRASIFKATDAESEDDFKIELKNAIEFFERSSNGATYFNYFNPSSPCCTFYKLFYTVIFEKAGAENELQNCLADAKSASKGSENEEMLIEAVENLANTLSEVHKVTDLDAMKSELNIYRRYCDHAADLIGGASEYASGAAQVLRSGLPMIDERIKEIVREIQGDVVSVCKRTRGTPLELHAPRIEPVTISETEQEIVRIAVAQISFDLTESFPFTIEKKDGVKTKVFSALEVAKHDGANIVCLPELCLCGEWISEIEKRYPDMIIIGGSFYKDNQNACPVIMKSDVDIPYQPKITPSPFEDGIMGPRMIPGDRIYRYETRFGKFVILICMDFDDLAHFFREADIDMIFCPSSNSANERFHNEAHSHVERTPSYILIANTGLYGGTSIFGQLNNKYFGELADRGCKEREDSTYKLCEVKEGQEEVIIADFNLNHKGAQVPIPSNPNKVIKSVDHIRKIPIQPDRSRI